VIIAGATLTVTNSASDADLPPQILTYNLINPPIGVGINPGNGLLTWRPFMAQAGTSNLLTISVADSGSPSLGATQSFWVTVNRPARPGLGNPLTSQGPFQIVVSGEAGPDYSLQGSTNLVNWTTIQTTNPPVIPFLFVDPNSSNYFQRFYRVILGP
jgi:hypothetical protein